MGKSSPPPAPDYAAAAVAQGQENRDTARFNAGANRVNQFTPQGSSTWTIRPGADPENPQPGDYIQTTALSPEQQRIYEQTAAIDNALLDTAQSQLGRVRATFDSPLDLSGLPAWRTSGQTGPQPSPMATVPRMPAPAPQAPSPFSSVSLGGSLSGGTGGGFVVGPTGSMFGGGAGAAPPSQGAEKVLSALVAASRQQR